MGIKFYRRYQSLKKFGNQDTYGIEFGRAYVFPKLDGTNSQAWFDGEVIQAGSRNRQLTLENDNAGFYNAIVNDENLLAFFQAHPNLRLYGEWLVPHSLKSYREDAWRKFYVFDVVAELNPGEENEEDFLYMSYDDYKPLLDKFGIEYIAPLGIVNNGNEEFFAHYLMNNKFLIQEGAGDGEGVVIKNYDYKNKFGRITWAKIITNEFKDIHRKEMGAPEINANPIEQIIVEKYVTKALIEKEYAKIVNAEDGWDSKFIPRLLETVYYCLITEELYDALKKEKVGLLNFKALRNFTIGRVKTEMKHLF